MDMATPSSSLDQSRNAPGLDGEKVYKRARNSLFYRSRSLLEEVNRRSQLRLISRQ